MIKRTIIYIGLLLLTAAGLDSCVADDVIGGGRGEEKEYRGTIAFDVSTPDMADRTRAVSTVAGGNIMVGNLWLGVFDVATGRCIGAMKNDGFNTTMTSGSVMKNMLKVDFVTKGTAVPLAYIVAVANYDGVNTFDGQPLGDLLPDFDNRDEINWEQVINLGIDTKSAYAGIKGENDNSNAPFMAGFYQDAVSLTQNPKIDQFAFGESPTAIYPSAAADGMDIELSDADGSQIYVAAGAICLRRLVSHNTLRFNMSNGYELTSVKYRRHNMPRTVYMLQRRTDTGRHSSFEEWQRCSPNFADKLLPESNFDISAPDFPYESDADWNEVAVNSWENNDDIVVVFDHFENKHWGFGDLQTQDDREARNPDGTFKALCNGPEDAWNNFASYFELGLHIVNKFTGESADVEYVLHEGFCNTDDGRRAETLSEKCRDFGSFRNVNYTYNINIAGISDITASVTSQDSNHPNGQTGSIWKMNFATGSGDKDVPIAGGDFNFNGEYMMLSQHPDLGFRIYGVDGNERIIDVCYNMPEGMYEGFSGLWPVGIPQNVTSPDGGAVPESLLKGMTVCSAEGGVYTLPEFVKAINGGTLSPSGKYYFRFTEYDGKTLGLSKNIERGIFIFDRNDVRNTADSDGCSRYNVAYGALQLPFHIENVQFDINKAIVWDNEYYPAVTTVKKSFYTKNQIFYGAEASAIDMRWRHDPRITGYLITVYNANFSGPQILLENEELERCIRDYGSEKIVIYPYSTATFPRSTSTSAFNYSFSIVPIVDESMYTLEGNFVISHNQNGDDTTSVRVCPTYWHITNTTDWKGLLPISGYESFEVFYRGLHTISTTEVSSQYNSTTYLCFGGMGNVGNRYFSFVASVPGKFEVVCMNHSSAGDPSRQLYIARIDENGSLTNGNVKYEQVYQSNSMPYKQTTFTTPVLQLNSDGRPTEFRIWAGGSIDYYSFRFIPN